MLLRLAVLLLLIAAPLCACNGLRQIGRGVKSQGMGGVGIANPQCALSQAANPANLIYLCDRADGDLFIVDQRGENLFWPEAAARLGWWGNQALGGAIYVYGDSKTHSCRHGAAFFSPAWAWSITPCHTIGIAINFALEWFAKSARLLDQPSVHPGRIAGQGRDVEWGINARFGWIGQLGRCVRAGLTYQTTTIVSHIRKYRGFLPGGGELHLPQEFGAGITWTPNRCFTLGLDVLELFWRDGIYYRNGRSSAPLGSNRGPGLGWRNQTVVKVGAAYAILPCLTLRAGYNHGGNPVPTGNPLTPLEPATISDHATAGVTYRLGKNEASLAYVHGFRHFNAIGIAYGRIF